MSTQHTPGPWIGAGPSFGDPLPRYTDEIVTVDEDEHGGVETICRLPFNHLDAENEANARLIAAAPDMLDALQFAIRFHDQLTPSDVERMRKIAEKATGSAT